MTKRHVNLQLSFVTEDSLGSRIIRLGTHSDYSHVDIITPDGYRIGARTDHPVKNRKYDGPIWNYSYDVGVQKRDLFYAPFTRDDRLLIACSEERSDEAFHWLYEQLGKPYDKTGLLRSFILNWPRRTPWRDEKEWWCSELAAAFVEHAGFAKCRTPTNRMSPNDTFIYAGCFAHRVLHCRTEPRVLRP